MKIKKLKLYTNKLALEKEFYSNTLGFDLIAEGKDFFIIKVGWSELTFHQSDKPHIYHYCFLIPSNRLNEALAWMEKRVAIIDVAKDQKIAHFESWNSHSFYFYDASGNIAEFIVRYDLNKESEAAFDSSEVLCVNEIGMPTSNVKKSNATLRNLVGTELWKGDLLRFGTNGSQEGLFLMPNYLLKHTWFPTSKKIISEPFEVLIENKGQEYELRFEKERIFEI